MATTKGRVEKRRMGAFFWGGVGWGVRRSTCHASDVREGGSLGQLDQLQNEGLATEKGGGLPVEIVFIVHAAVRVL